MIKFEDGCAGGAPAGRYAVVCVGDQWRLMHGANTIGQFGSLETASNVAEALCRAVDNVGFDVRLTVQTRTGELRDAHLPSGLRP
jgi:hypothetical protein